MQLGNTVLIVSGGGVDLELGKVLNDAGVTVRLAKTCAEARDVVAKCDVPCVLFSDVSLPDGTWIDILTLANEGERNIPVILLSRVVDIALYISALEAGACDFVVPPYYHQDIAHILKCAANEGLAVQRIAAA